jgi:thiamine biosynthesis lipoprotein
MLDHLRFQSLAVLLSLLAACTTGSEHPVLELRGETMGTSYSIQVVDLAATIDPDALREKIDAELESVNAIMSTYREDSELSAFNRSRSTDWLPVSPELASLVKEALWTSEVSRGAFDLTVGPLVNLWGFGPGERIDAAPTDAQIAQARKHVGYHKLSARQVPPALRKSDPDLYLDLSAIAKGYGVDRVAELLERAAIANYLVEIGGELRGRGYNGQGLAWRIAIERPDPGLRQVERIVELCDGAMATSGDYRNFFESNGKRYSHMIDPKTGRPVTHDLASVTVLAPRTARADALATTFLVLGPEAGLTLAESLKTPALFIQRTPEGYIELETNTFDSAARSIFAVTEEPSMRDR